ncbi:MAG: FkbM family methyltransferase, partial [Pseudomonadota bacterium]
MNLAKRISGKLNALTRQVANMKAVDKRLLFQFQEITSLSKLFALMDVDCVFDIGANRGQYAKLLRSQVKYRGRILSFEPGPAPYNVLDWVSRNDSLWHTEQIALGEENGTASLNVMALDVFNSIAKPGGDSKQFAQGQNVVKDTVEVRQETLETAFLRLHKEFGF